MPERPSFIVAYDIRCPRRLKQALLAVRTYASGGQKSVHECRLSTAERLALLASLRGIVDATEDNVLLLRLEPRSGVRRLGIARPPLDGPVLYVG